MSVTQATQAAEKLGDSLVPMAWGSVTKPPFVPSPALQSAAIPYCAEHSAQ
jgi:hypothetical protein